MSTQFVIVEGVDGRGNLLLRQRIALTPTKPTITIGSGPEVDVMLDDADMALLHATLTLDAEGRLTATDHGAPQGVMVDGTRHRGVSGIALPSGALQIGSTRLQATLLHAGTAAAAKPVAPSRWPLAIAIMGGLVSVASAVYGAWADQPADLPVAVLSRLGMLAVVALIWIGIWAGLSRRNFGNARWAIHSAIFFAISALAEAVGNASLLAAFATSTPMIAKLNGTIVQVGLSLCLMIFLHLRYARHWTLRTRLLAAFGLPLVLGLASAWMTSRWQRTDVTSMNADLRLYPPAFKLAKASTTKAFFEDAVALKAKAKTRLEAVPKHLLERVDEDGDATD